VIRSRTTRWFTAPATRQLYTPEDPPVPLTGVRIGLREIVTLREAGSRAAHLADLLLAQSEEFQSVWDDDEVGLRFGEIKHFVQPELVALELNCQTLLNPRQSHPDSSTPQFRAARATTSYQDPDGPFGSAEPNGPRAG